MTVGSALTAYLVSAGVTTIYGVLGNANMYMVHDLVETHGIDYVAAAREDGAVMMAYGHARSSGGLGVATVTYGPGLTNALTALVETARNDVPLLVLTGHFPVLDRHQDINDAQEIDQTALLGPTGALSVVLDDPATAVDRLAEAVWTAVVHRRVVVVAVPTDVGDEDGPAGPLPAVPARPAPPVPDPADLDRAVGVITTMRRPLILAGRGAVLSGAAPDLRALADRLGAPVSTTLFARTLFADDPWDIGVFGTVATDLASRIIDESDGVIAFGTSLNRWTTSAGGLLSGKAVVLCDVDPSPAAGVAEDAVVVGDAAASARVMKGMLDAAGHSPRSRRTEALAAEVAAYTRASEFADGGTRGTVDMRTFCVHLDGMLPPDRAVVVDLGRFMGAPLRYLSVPDPDSFLLAMRFGSIGLGLGMAVGAAHARPDRPTVLVVGDGGLMMSWPEFATAVRLGHDLVIVVMNDGGYGAEYHNFVDRGLDPSLSLIPFPDPVPIACAMGGAGVVAQSLDDLDEVAAAIARRRGALVIDVRIDPSPRIPL